MLTKTLMTISSMAVLLASTPLLAWADAGFAVKATLSGYNEVPAVSSTGKGSFNAKIDRDSQTIHYEMTYTGLEGSALQSHIHIGQKHTTGGISAFLCTNLGNAPSTVPACPITAGTVSGAIQAGDVIGPNGQGIAPGEFAELVAAVRAGAAYANVHTNKVPSGEIRGQINLADD